MTENDLQKIIYGEKANIILALCVIGVIAIGVLLSGCAAPVIVVNVSQATISVPPAMLAAMAP